MWGVRQSPRGATADDNILRGEDEGESGCGGVRGLQVRLQGVQELVLWLCLEGGGEVRRLFSVGRLRLDLGQEGLVGRGLECCRGEVWDEPAGLPRPAYPPAAPCCVRAALGAPRGESGLGVGR